MVAPTIKTENGNKKPSLCKGGWIDERKRSRDGRIVKNIW